MDMPILGLVPRMIPRLILLFALAVPLACGDDDGGIQPPPGPSVRGAVTMIGTGTPMPDVQVILIDPASLAPRSRIARTDTAGVYQIAERVPAGTYALLLFADSTAVFDRARPYLEVEDGRTTVHDVRMVDSELWAQHPPFIDGVVLNDATGAPVPGAWIDSGLWGWQGVDIRLPQMGITTSEMAVTDGEGRFRVTSSIVTNEEGQPAGLFPVNVTADGFEPTTLVGRGPDVLDFGPALPLPEAGSDSVLRVTIRMAPLGADGAGPHGIGSITGTVIDAGGRPVGGVAVAASLVRSAFPDTFPPGRQRAPVPSRTAFTDAAGRFTITRLSPGDYGIQPAFLIGDGYVYEASGVDEAEWPVSVGAGHTVEAGTLGVARTLTPLAPAHGAEVDRSLRSLSWTPMPNDSGYEGVWYRLWLSYGYIEDLAVDHLPGPRWELPDGFSFAPGMHIRWYGEAYAAIGTPPETVLIGTFEEAAAFTVR